MYQKHVNELANIILKAWLSQDSGASWVISYDFGENRGPQLRLMHFNLQIS